MKPLHLFIFGMALLSMGAGVAQAEVKVTIEHNPTEIATGAFQFKSVPPPCKNDAGTKARFALVDGRRDGNGGTLDVLHDGQAPLEEDAPGANFFFNPGTDGGRILVDLGRALAIQQVHTYSWHPGARGPQVYALYASDGSAAGFNAEPKKGTAPDQCGWRLIANVDSRPKDGEGGGQYGVSISESSGTLGTYRYLLFDISRTESRDSFGNTFYSEIDILESNGPTPEFLAVASGPGAKEVVEAEGGKYQMILDTSETPDLTDWARREIAPLMREWYPKLVQMLPSDGYEAPTKFSLVFKKDMDGVADTSHMRIRGAAKWIRANLKSEAKGALFHEMVHVVQDYGRAPRGSTHAPGWLTEGLADYLRWYYYEPQSKGAEISRRSLAKARYDDSYRVTANFLHWVTEKYDKDLVMKLNAAIREGRYGEDPWKKNTGHTVQELGDEWKKALEEKFGTQSPTTPAAH